MPKLVSLLPLERAAAVTSDEDRWLATLRARRAAGAYAVATLEDVERLIKERDDALAEVARLEHVASFGDGR